ncbi:MAG: Gfo/Idh/MocA family oxidoreductase [Planctomycetes bacterium]|nr:Gfo/Idh/MocA family oxidoreductase [Planctomycetota bacterium]
MSDIRIGIVGLNLGQWQIETLAGLEGVQVAAVADSAAQIRVPEKGPMTVAGYAESIGAAAYADGVEMIECADLDAVSLCVSPKYREPLMVAAAQKKRPVLMEKPMACCTAQGERFAKIAADAGILFMMEYPLRYYPAMVKLKSLLDDGPLGKALSVTGELQASHRPGKDHWLWDPENGNGYLNECITHLYDTMCFLCGAPRKVFASGGNYWGPADMAASAAAVIEFENGSSAAINGGGLGSSAFGVPMYVHVYAENGEALVTGPTWMYDRIEWALTGDSEKSLEEFDLPPRRQIMRYSMEHFLQSVRNQTPPTCGAEDGLNAMRIVDGLKESIAAGQAVELL